VAKKVSQRRSAGIWGAALTPLTSLLALWNPGVWFLAFLTALCFSLLVLRSHWIEKAPHWLGKPLRFIFIFALIWGGPTYVGWHIFHRTAPIRKDPVLVAKCSLLDDQSACSTRCTVKNLAIEPDATAQNVSLGFHGLLPYQTKLDADTDTHIFIRKQETLPMPRNGIIDKSVIAFSVEIPLIPANSQSEFVLSSLSIDNQKACEYLKTSIRSEQRRKMDVWLRQAAQQNKVFDLDKLVSAQAKMDSLFIPGYLMSSYGRQKIEFLTEEEERATNEFDGWINARGSKDDSLFFERQCTMPVFAAEQNDSKPRYFFRGSGMMAWPMPLKQTPVGFEADFRPPDQYLCVPQQISAQSNGSVTR
jgi:hypothetical protein